MATHATDLRAADRSTLLMKYCFLCDQAGPHYTAQIEDDLVFQCHACFATHADHVEPDALAPGQPRAALGRGRHRVG